MKKAALKTERAELIRQHLFTHGALSVTELATIVGSSIATVRRDLDEMQEQGLIERVYGGARLTGEAPRELAFELRAERQIEAKRAIADLAYRKLQPGSTCFFDASTTVFQLVRRLRSEPMPLKVLTNGLAVAQGLLSVPELQVTVLGGAVRPENSSIMGAQAEAMLRGLRIDQLFLGVTAIHDDMWIYGSDPTEASLNALMIDRSRECFLLADSTKFGGHANFGVAALGSGTSVLSDSGLPNSWRKRLSEQRVPLEIATLL